MRIYRVNDKEQMELPPGFTVARDGLSTPIPPNGYVGKVEYIDTHHASPCWRTACDTQPNYVEDLAVTLHTYLCGNHHSADAVDSGCKFDHPNRDAEHDRQLWKKRARQVLKIIRETHHIPTEAAFVTAIAIATALNVTKPSKD